jgi:hypothetical protein
MSRAARFGIFTVLASARPRLPADCKSDIKGNAKVSQDTTDMSDIERGSHFTSFSR